MSRRRPLASRARGYARQLLAFLFSNVGVIVLVLGYTIAGAFMFQAIEGASEMERVNHMALERNSTAHYLWQNVTLTLNLFNETALKDRIRSELRQYQGTVVRAVRRGWDGGRSSRQWSFSSAFLYSLTVITTIGYGHLSPRTSWGKITTILYTLLGMPLFLLYLSNVGELLAQWCKCLYALVCLCRGCPGFTRRRVARLRTQEDNSVSEAESIERPEDWSSDSTPHLGPPSRRPDYLRSVSMPQPSWRYPTGHRDPRSRGWSEDPRVRGYLGRERLRGWTEDPRDSRDHRDPTGRVDSRDPRLRNWGVRSWVDPKEVNGLRDPRDPWMRGWVDPRYVNRSIYRRDWDSRDLFARVRGNHKDFGSTDPSFRGLDSKDLRTRGWIDPEQFGPSDPRFRDWVPRDPRMRGWLDPVDARLEPFRAESPLTSEFSYVTFDAQTIAVPISVCVFIMVGYIMFGSMIFGLWEKWDQLDGAYFCFISLSSIGFGDFVPGERVYTPRIETSFIVCSLYLMLGMALVAMCFNLMQEQVIHYVAGLKRAALRVCRCKR